MLSSATLELELNLSCNKYKYQDLKHNIVKLDQKLVRRRSFLFECLRSGQVSQNSMQNTKLEKRSGSSVVYDFCWRRIICSEKVIVSRICSWIACSGWILEIRCRCSSCSGWILEISSGLVISRCLVDLVQLIKGNPTRNLKLEHQTLHPLFDFSQTRPACHLSLLT